MRILKRVMNAIKFMTIFPLPDSGEVETKELGKSAAYFPVAGFLIGAVLLGVYALSTKSFSPFLTATLVLCAWAWLTGLLHLDGLVDTADGFSAGPDKEKILAVMKDTHCGAKGICVLVLFLLLKVALLNELLVGKAWPWLLLIPMLSRWGMTSLAVFCEYARPAGLGAAFVTYARKEEFLIASVITGGLGAVFAGWSVFVYMAVIMSGVLILKWYLKRKIGGITGDILGASNEAFEIFGLLIVLIMR